MLKRFFSAVFATALLFTAAAPSMAAATKPDEFVAQLTNNLLDQVRKDPALKKGDINQVMALVDQQVLPHVNFERMTSSAAGPAWRKATDEQKQKLQQEFKTLLVRTYSGALTQVKNHKLELKPFRAEADAKEVIVRSLIKDGNSDPIALDYRLEKTGDAWKIYDVNVAGIWLVENYRSSFKQEIAQGGIDGLISKLAERNKAAAAKK